MLIAALLAASSVGAAAAPVADPPAAGSQRSSMTIVAEARATISNPVVLRGSTIDTRAIGTLPVRQPPRRCPSADSTAPDCRLIVYDLP
jgi:hypothetical protein